MSDRCERCGRIGPHPEHEEPSAVPVGRGSVRAERRRRIREGIRQAKAGQTAPASEVLEELGL